jgi:hypothetical protein
MLRALIEGKTTIQEMDDLGKGKLRQKISAWELALGEKLEDYHPFLLPL